MITEKAFRKYLNQSRLFQIFLADGRTIHVPQGEHISVQPGGRMFLMCGCRTADTSCST
jgi:hypothetical protein